jgi:hypothetical protein
MQRTKHGTAVSYTIQPWFCIDAYFAHCCCCLAELACSAVLALQRCSSTGHQQTQLCWLRSFVSVTSDGFAAVCLRCTASTSCGFVDAPVHTHNPSRDRSLPVCMLPCARHTKDLDFVSSYKFCCFVYPVCCSSDPAGNQCSATAASRQLNWQ